MGNTHVRKGDEIVVISGVEKGKRGKVISVSKARDRVIVEGLKLIKRHVRKGPQHPEGAIVDREGTIHISNVVKADQHDARVAKRTGAAAKS